MPSNLAAWQTEAKKIPFEVKEAPYPKPAADEVVVKNAAVAINPIDFKTQRYAFFPIKYPTVFGSDVAGEIVETGSSVSNVKKGDRVTAYAHSLGNDAKPEYAGFQKFTLCNHSVVAPLPSFLSFEQGAVLPLAISTAAAGLYEKDFLSLPYPSLNPKSTGQSLLVWGGSSSVGAMTIQLAKASGYEVVTTASKHNFAFVKGLGADLALDYKSNTIVDELVDALRGKTVAGAYDAASASGSVEACAEVLVRSKGSKFIAATLPPPANLPDGVTAKFLQATAVLNSAAGKAVWLDYLPKALQDGKLKAAPDAMVVGNGIQDIQKACDRLAEGVSAAKVVCTI